MKHRRSHSLRRRYGRSFSTGTYEVTQASSGVFLVTLTRDLEVGSAGKTVPGGTRLGTVNDRGTIKVWRSSGSVPRGYAEAAKSLLEAAKHDLKSSGQIMSKQRAREAADEQASGSFIIKIDGGPTLRAHDMVRARAAAEKELMTRPIGTQAKFFRATVSDKHLEGAPWTVPFHVEEAYEWNGQKRVGMAK